ncbi:MAG TPA: hypothetical protein PKK31_11210, partial [Elusimicrobiales bacterium]|nr:hypothetical protein [Elusimicrobiales bacterium]
MDPADELFIGLGGLALGAVLAVFGYLKEKKAASLASAPQRPCCGLEPGVPQVISGRVEAPLELKAPVSGRSCAFFLAEIEVARFVQSGRSGGVRWTRAETRPYGFFFVDDSFGRALVFPTQGSLDLVRSPENDGALFPTEGDRRTTESVILQGETVTVLGSPRPLSSFLDYLRSTPEVSLPAEGLERLMELSRDGAALSCFFGEGVSVVADQPCSEYVSSKRGSASSYIWSGLALALLSAWFFI